MVGEHIRALKEGRWVHAIDCGDETVLHLAEDAAPPRVRRAYRPEFVAGAETVEHVTHRERTFAPKEIVRRAYSRAADPTLAAMFGDSESFAAWCTTGRSSGPRNFAVQVPAAAAPGTAADPAVPSVPRRAKRPAVKRTAASRPVRRTAASRPAKRASAKGSARATSTRKATAGAKSTRAGKRPAARTSGAKRTAKPARRRRARR